MNIQQSFTAFSLVFALSISIAHAGPCSSEIDSAMTEFGAILNARAAGGATAQQSTAAMMHRQPTPKSVAAAESSAGDLSAKKVRAVEEAMAQARKADGAGDQAACQQALADARRAARQ